jgi:hypothetical protein
MTTNPLKQYYQDSAVTCVKRKTEPGDNRCWSILVVPYSIKRVTEEKRK